MTTRAMNIDIKAMVDEARAELLKKIDEKEAEMMKTVAEYVAAQTNIGEGEIGAEENQDEYSTMSKEDAKRYIADMIKDLKEKMQEEMDDVGNALEFKTFDYERSSTLKGVEGQLEFERERAKKILAFEIKYQNAVRSRIGGAHVAEQEGDRDEKHLSEVWDRFAFAMTNEQAVDAFEKAWAEQFSNRYPREEPGKDHLWDLTQNILKERNDRGEEIGPHWSMLTPVKICLWQRRDTWNVSRLRAQY